MLIDQNVNATKRVFEFVRFGEIIRKRFDGFAERIATLRRFRQSDHIVLEVKQAPTRAVLPAMRRQGDGLIINIGSILGRVTFPFFGIYGASKFAIEALTDSLRYEVCHDKAEQD